MRFPNITSVSEAEPNWIKKRGSFQKTIFMEAFILEIIFSSSLKLLKSTGLTGLCQNLAVPVGFQRSSEGGTSNSSSCNFKGISFQFLICILITYSVDV